MLDDVAACGLPHVDKPFSEVPFGFGAFAVMGRNGDTKYIWNRNNPAEVEAARTVFDMLKKQNYLAFSVRGEGEQGEQVREFEPNLERLIFTPQLQGG